MKTLKEKIKESSDIIAEHEASNKSTYDTLIDFTLSDNKAKSAIERMVSNNSAIKKQVNIIKKLSIVSK